MYFFLFLFNCFLVSKAYLKGYMASSSLIYQAKRYYVHLSAKTNIYIKIIFPPLLSFYQYKSFHHRLIKYTAQPCLSDSAVWALLYSPMYCLSSLVVHFKEDLRINSGSSVYRTNSTLRIKLWRYVSTGRKNNILFTEQEHFNYFMKSFFVCLGYVNNMHQGPRRTQA